ncbi:MAG TPA: AsnC family transcriptional regulator [Methanomassiliicoccales archaeon]|nr:AsnC family transcriptional regulator [Methanomassiliicoccales archaeon]
MDETDIAICMILMQDSRTPFRKVADRLGLSVQATHRRIQQLEDEGVLSGYRTNLSLTLLNPVVLYVMGTAGAQDVTETIKRLSQDERTYIVLESDRHYLTIGALLRDIKEMEEYVDFVRRITDMTAPTLGLANITRTVEGEVRLGSEDDIELTSMDYRIVHNLYGDARKPVEKVAEELNLSPATVRRRLDRMIDLGAVEFSIDWRPSASSSTVAQLLIDLKPGANKQTLAGHFLQHYSDRLVAFITFSNLPDFIFCVAWSKNMRELTTLLDRVADEDQVDRVRSNIVQREHLFPTWRKSELDRLAKK